MLSEERIMEIAECCPVWYAIPQGREKALLTKFARAIEREAYKQGQEDIRERTAEHMECSHNWISREAASYLIRNLEIEEPK